MKNFWKEHWGECVSACCSVLVVVFGLVGMWVSILSHIDDSTRYLSARIDGLSTRVDSLSVRMDGSSARVDAVLDTILTMQKQISVNQATLTEFIRGHEREHDIQGDYMAKRISIRINHSDRCFIKEA